MPRARDIAVEAVARERLAMKERELAEQRAAEEAERARQYSVHETACAAERLLGREEWFPGVEWRVVDDSSSLGAGTGFDKSGQNVVLMDEQDRNDAPLKLLVHRCTDGSGPALEVYFVRLDRDRDTQYNYWHGGQVKSALDVGKALSL